MKTIVLSAFRTFGEYTANSTELVARSLHGKQFGGFIIRSIVFDAIIPTENRGAGLFTIAQKIGAAGIISLGMASEKTGLCVERIAINKIYSPKYCSPSQNRTPVDVNRKYEERVFLSIAPWSLGRFKSTCATKRIPVMQDSIDAGGFCCNHLAYQARIAQTSSDLWSKIPYIFLHVPCSPEAVPNMKDFRDQGKTTMTVDEIAAGVKALIVSAKL